MRALAEAGCNTIIHYHRSKEAAEELSGAIVALGVEVRTIGADLSREEECRELFESACTLSGGVDLLVNSASIFPESRIENLEWEDLEANMRLHAWAPLKLSRLLAEQPRFRELKDPIDAEKLGAIINLLDTRISDADPNHAAYHLSKRTLFSLTRMMSLSFAPAVRVNAIAPGLILPPPGETEEYLERFRSYNPLKRFGSPGEIADALLYLAQAPFVTGQVLYVDGGRRLKGSMYGS